MRANSRALSLMLGRRNRSAAWRKEPAHARHEGGRLRRVRRVSHAKFCLCLPLLLPRQPEVSEGKQGEQNESRQSGPFQQESDHDQDEGDVLRMSGLGVGSGCCEEALPPSLIEPLPACAEENHAANDEAVTQPVQGAQVGITAPTGEGLPEMPAAMSEDVDLREAVDQPSRDEVDGQWETVHLGEQSDDEGRESP